MKKNDFFSFTSHLNGNEDNFIMHPAGEDFINGGQGDAPLVGTGLSATDIDGLTGGEEKDFFVLGNTQGVFYSNAGNQD